MAKYFSGITVNDKKYTISIIDDNLNIIFLDNLEIDKLIDLLKRKSVSSLSVNAPLALYLKYYQLKDKNKNINVKIQKRPLDNIINSRNLLTYGSSFTPDTDTFQSSLKLYQELNNLGFCIRKPREVEKSIIESYPDTSFLALGCNYDISSPCDETFKKKIEFLKYKGIRIKDYLKRSKKDMDIEINTLCQAFIAYLYYTGDSTCLGSQEDGILILPTKDLLDKIKPIGEQPRKLKFNISVESKQEPRKTYVMDKAVTHGPINKFKNYNVIAEYCGAQYLYTNLDGVIRINDLRPIKSYRPFTEIYEMKYIKLVQVIIGTTDGLRRVKANLIPNTENSNSFKAADDEDKKKLDSFWGNTGDKRGYLIKFNKVEVIKA